jgi:hypothetical protein
MATALHDLAAIYQVQGQYAKAEPLYLRRAGHSRERRWVRIIRLWRSRSWTNLAGMESAQGRRTTGRRSIMPEPCRFGCRMNQFGKDDPRVAEALAGYAKVLRKTCHRLEAATAEARSRAILAKAAFR